MEDIDHYKKLLPYARLNLILVRNHLSITMF